MSVSYQDVVGAYQNILGREPENSEVVRDKANHCKDFTSLRGEFFRSKEFIEGYSSGKLYEGFPSSIIRRRDVLNAYRFFLGRYPESEAAVQKHVQMKVPVREFFSRILRSNEFRLKFEAFLAEADIIKPNYLDGYAERKESVQKDVTANGSTVFLHVRKGEWDSAVDLMDAVISSPYREEVVLIDNGMNEETLQLFEQYRDMKRNPMRIIRMQESDDVIAKVKAIPYASGERVAFLDAKDEPDVEWIHFFEEITVRVGDIDVFIGGAPESNLYAGQMLISAREAIQRMIRGEGDIHTLHRKLYRKELFHGITVNSVPMEEEEFFINYQILKKSNKICIQSSIKSIC